MPRSEPERHRELDWRAWVLLTWVAVVGLLYARMVIEQRGAKLMVMLTGWLDWFLRSV